MILVIGMAVLVWFLWGAAFDPEPNKGRVERAISHPGRWSKRVMCGWIEDAKEVLKDPLSTEEEKEKAMRDIDAFSQFVSKEELAEFRREGT
jgi:hypothetical protein